MVNSLRKVKREIIYLASVFLLLCVVSAYWQIGKRYFPTDAIRPVVIYFIYTTLLAIWCVMIHNRITQRNMRVFLTVENICMLFGMSIRFIQEALWYYFTGGPATNNDVFLMRLSGYCTNIAFILIPLFGVYAAFGLTKTEDYRFNRKWYLLFIPSASLIFIVLTNDMHHFAYRLIYDEVQATLYYLPSIGFYLIIVWTFSLLFSRLFILYKRSRKPRLSPPVGAQSFTRGDAFRLTPVFFTVLIILANIPYITTAFVVEFELLEQEVTLFFLEILIWESCILVGMVPVNTQYDEVFDRSTVAMQIVTGDGKSYLRSSGAPVLSPVMFNKLMKTKTVRTPKGIDYHLHPIRGGYCVWLNDVSKTLAVINELRQSSTELEQEGVLIGNELAIRSYDVALKEQNDIFNRLIDEIGGQMFLLRHLLETLETADDKTILFKRICLIGVYIKRRCHLRLVEQSDGIITNADLKLCYYEISDCLVEMGIDSDIQWRTPNSLKPEFAIFALDALEVLLEYERFNVRSINMDIITESEFAIHMRFNNVSTKQIPVDELRRINKENFNVKWQLIHKGYQINVDNYEENNITQKGQNRAATVVSNV